MAHLQAQATRRQPITRFDAKLALVRSLYRRGYDAERVSRLLRFIDWVLRLSEELKPRFWKEVEAMEQVERVPYLMQFERKAEAKGYKVGKKEGKVEGKQEGVREGLLTAIELGLTVKFGDDGAALMPAFTSISDSKRLESILAALMTDATLDELQSRFTINNP